MTGPVTVLLIDDAAAMRQKAVHSLRCCLRRLFRALVAAPDCFQWGRPCHLGVHRAAIADGAIGREGVHGQNLVQLSLSALLHREDLHRAARSARDAELAMCASHRVQARPP
jgi:hypothetical protein